MEGDPSFSGACMLMLFREASVDPLYLGCFGSSPGGLGPWTTALKGVQLLSFNVGLVAPWELQKVLGGGSQAKGSGRPGHSAAHLVLGSRIRGARYFPGTGRIRGPAVVDFLRAVSGLHGGGRLST